MITVESANQCEQVIPAQWFITPVGQGDFTCCKLDHKVPTADGTRDIGCDKPGCAVVLSRMYDHKMSVLETTKQLQEWRFVKSRRPALFTGLPHEYATQPAYKTAAEFLEDFKFDGVNDGLEDGWTLLRYAVLLNDARACELLVAAGADVEAPTKAHYSKYFHTMDQTIGHSAALFADTAVLAVLAKAGCNFRAHFGG